MIAAFTTSDKLACVSREIRQRLRVYPRWVEQGRYTQQKADWEIACMRAVEADLKRQLQAEDPDLFTRVQP